MTHIRQHLLVLVSAILISTAQIHAADSMSPEAKAYLGTALQIIQQNFLHREHIDWERLKTETIAQAAGAQTAVDTYPAIRFALGKLGDHHSFLQLTPALIREATARGVAATAPPPAPPRKSSRPPSPFPSPFRTRRVAEGGMVLGATKPIAQVVIPLFSGPDLDSFATQIQKVIADLAEQKPCGWIVDLRGNGGGNIWPMLAGVGPILGEGDHSNWFYERGRAGNRKDKEHPYAKTQGNPVKLDRTPPVAVLIDRETGSSGEGIAIAFRGRPDTRFFGETTYGTTTSTFPYPLSDGATIYLVVRVMMDRNGKEYPDGVSPDEEILSDTSITTTDSVIRRAAEWLSKAEGCRESGN